jgi:SNF2 family DNA or RNA helicase
MDRHPLKLRPVQEQAADFLYEHDHALLLAWVGAGKTATALTAIRDMVRDGHARRVLVLAPLRVANEVWPVEAALWAPDLRLVVCHGTPGKRWAALTDDDAQVVVATYDNLQWLAEQTFPTFDVLVYDELTRLKNPSGKRFKAFAKVAESIPVRWGLTASFTSNGLEDVFGQCKAVSTDILGRAKGAFLQQYFYCLNREHGEWAAMPGSLEKVMERIKPYTFVVEAREYRDTLPPLYTVTVPLAMDLAPYKRLKRDMVLQYRDATITAGDAAVVTGKLQQLSSGFLYTDHGAVWLSDHKMNRLEELLDENQRARSIICYNFKEELAELKRRLPKTVTLDDKNAVTRWNKGEVEILAVHPKSAGHGLNLQHGGHTMIWLSLPWSLELYEQTIGRLHRSGQKHAVQVYVLQTAGTVEVRQMEVLNGKRTLSELAQEELK